MQIVIQKLFTPKDKRKEHVIANATEGLQRPLKVLDEVLSGRSYLLGDDFTIADLNVAGVMHLLKMVEFDCSNHANVSRWLDACYARPSMARAQARD